MSFQSRSGKTIQLGKFVHGEMSNYDEFLESSIPNLLCENILYGLAKYSHDKKVSVRDLFAPDSWTRKSPPCCLRFVMMGGNPGVYVIFIELRYIENEKRYIWFMQHTKEYGGREFYYEDNFLTFLVFHAFLVVYEDVHEKENLQIAQHCLEKFLDDTNFEIPTAVMEKISSPMVLLYAVFYDKKKWKLLGKEQKQETEEKKEEAENYDSYFNESYGLEKSVTIAGKKHSVWYCSGDDLMTSDGCSYLYTMRAALHYFIVQNCENSE